MKLLTLLAGILFIPAFATIAQDGTIINVKNSELPSNKINTIHIDSSNVKWIGTNMGLSRFDDLTWKTYDNTDATLLNNNVKDLAYERTAYGTELWIATDSGLSVTSYDTDGVTGSTTYTTENSGIAENNISNVGVDVLHSRWITTDTCISIFHGSTWDTITIGLDNNVEEFPLSEISAFTDIEFIVKDSITLISTTNKGVLRYNLDGTTGASAYGKPWSNPFSDNINDIEISEPTQWYASAEGAFEHTSNNGKSDWTEHSIVGDTLSSNITTIYVDNNNIWFGSENGLAIFDGNDWFWYNASDGLVNDTINNITSDMQDNVWVGTMGGIEWFSDIPGKKHTNLRITNITSNTNFSIYPNPADAFFMVDFVNPENQVITLKIYNLNGQLIDTPVNTILNEGMISIPVVINPVIRRYPGMYVVRITGKSIDASLRINIL